MRRFLLHTASFVVALFVALLLADVVGVVPAAQPPFVCPDGAEAVWGPVRHEMIDRDLPTLICRDDQGRPHGPSFNWADGHLLGLAFWSHGQRTGAGVLFHENGRVWSVGDESAESPFLVAWSESGLRQTEEVRQGDVTRIRTWHANGRPKDVGAYRNGARDGDWTCSDESGEHTIRATYSEGRLVSRTGDVDAEHMADRCQESTCGRPAGAGVDAVAEAGEAGTENGRCPSGVS